MKLLPILADIPDQRTREGRRYDLPHILLFTLLAMLSGADSYRKVASFIEVRFPLLKGLCHLTWKRPPAYTTLRDILRGLDQVALEAAFRQHAAALVTLPPNEVIAIDGKVLRGSFDHISAQQATLMVSAFASHEAIVLGHIMLDHDEKASEIPAAQQLISALGLTGKLFSLDALHTQKNSGDSPSGRESLISTSQG